MSFLNLRKRVIVVCASAALLAAAGCSTPAQQPDQKADPGNSTYARGGAGFSTADEETAKLGSTAAPGVFPRTVTHANGTTEIKSKPQRVVALGTGEIDSLLAVGITPVGITVTKGASPVPTYLADKVASAQQVGDSNNLNLEAIAALKPDLIISTKARHDKLYDQLSQIAPTVFTIRTGFPWKENFRLIADATGDENKADEVMAAYSAKVEAVKKANTKGATVSLLRFAPGKVRLYATKSLTGVVLADAGIARPANQQVEDISVEISVENIAQSDGGLLLWSSYGTAEATGEDKVIASEAWKAIPAVKEGRAHRIDDDVWFLGLGPIGAGKILDDLEGFLK